MRRAAFTPLIARLSAWAPTPSRWLHRTLAACGILAFGGLGHATETSAVNALGLPFSRTYSFEEIGNASRGARLSFDHLGRIGVMGTGAYSVLNDTSWIDLSDKDSTVPTMQRVYYAPDGQPFYGAFASWGLVETNSRGLLRPRPLTPQDAPQWVMATSFTEIVFTKGGVFFGGFGGAVYWDRGTGRQTFFEIPEIARIFAVGDVVYASSHVRGIARLDLATGTPVPVVSPGADAAWIDQVIRFGPDLALLSTKDGHLRLFDGREFFPWPGPLGERPTGRVTALHLLPGGNVAIAVAGRGLFLVSGRGEILSGYTTPEYHRIIDLAAREPGVLWLATENGIEKILYQSPLTVFGQRLGLPISWPQIVRWKDRIVVASGGRLYETRVDTEATGQPFHETRQFRLVAGQPTEETWGIAGRGDHLLIANASGVFVRRDDGAFARVLSDINVARLVMIGDDLCYVIGALEIAVLRRTGDRWAECAPRAPGLRYPAIVHAAGSSAWIELGANRAARISLKDGALRVAVFDDFPWKAPKWTNIGVLGDLVVLSGMPDGRVFFDERTESFVERPDLRKLLDQAPHPITRVRQDETGTIWAAHDTGLLMFEREGEGYRPNPTTYGRINDRFPSIHLLAGDDVWLTTGQSLYHVDRRFALTSKSRFKPILASMTDGRTGRDLLANRASPDGITRLSYAENSLVLRFFAGTYATRQPPSYEFKLHRGNDSWVTVGNGSLLTLTDLREGRYRLEVRAADSAESRMDPLFFEFDLAPPWYRTWFAFVFYAVGIAALIYGLVRWSIHRTRSRNVVLEKLVAERTNELRIAMQQLNEETRNAATLAERDRLAGEIHDSLQQGLSGLMLHLDATLKLADLPADVRSRLSLARNMVSFTRHEVQHAVWDMETPLLEDTELGDALKKISSLIGPGAAQLRVEVVGAPFELSSATKHHLLRIAQEAITNAVRHAAANSIEVVLTYAAASVTLAVTDDGAGFEPRDVLTKGLGHFGLRGLRGRASKIGGEVRIDSALGRGTTVIVQVPVAVPAYSHADYRS